MTSRNPPPGKRARGAPAVATGSIEFCSSHSRKLPSGRRMKIDGKSAFLMGKLHYFYGHYPVYVYTLW